MLLIKSLYKSERTSVTLLAWLSESNVVTPSTAPLRSCFSLVPPSVPLRFLFFSSAVMSPHKGKVVPLHIFTQDIIHTSRGGGNYYFFFPSGDFQGTCFIIKKHVHYLSAWFLAKLPLISLWLERSMAAHPVSEQTLVQPCRSNSFIKGQLDWKHREIVWKPVVCFWILGFAKIRIKSVLN